MKKIISVDFDGVLNSYLTPFTTASELTDPPVPGAIEWLQSLIDKFNVNIFSTRCIEVEGQIAIANWLLRWGLSHESINLLHFTAIKHGASVYIDDRAWRFEGTFPSCDELEKFKPWNKI